jgi:hypothetical protein
VRARHCELCVEVGPEGGHRCSDASQCGDVSRLLRLAACHLEPVRHLLRLYYEIHHLFWVYLEPLFEGLAGHWSQLKQVASNWRDCLLE